MIRTDVIVVGGGPIGLAAAIEARLAGLEATVIEQRRDPVDKACGEGLMPGAVDALSRLGVRPRGATIAGIRYSDARSSAEHRFRHGAGRGVRRTELQAALAARAVELGVVRIADRVAGIDQREDWVAAGGVRGRWLLGCDGLHSAVARMSGLAVPTGSPRRYGVRRHFAADAPDLVEVHWTADSEAYLTPVAPGVVGLAVLGPSRLDFVRTLAEVPGLADRLGEPLSELRGAGPLRQDTRGRVAGRVLLVGDASGYVDAITGEGVRVGLAQARAAVAALVTGNPARYERTWRSATREARLLTAGLVRLASSSQRGRIVPLARSHPSVFATAVERLAR